MDQRKEGYRPLGVACGSCRTERCAIFAISIQEAGILVQQLTNSSHISIKRGFLKLGQSGFGGMKRNA